MTLEEFYVIAGSSLDNALARLRREELIKKYLKMFLLDDNFSKLGPAVEAADWRAVFEATHALKGLAGNLELTNLFSVSSALCEEVRHGDPTGDAKAMYQAIADEYNKVSEAIKQVA